MKFTLDGGGAQAAGQGIGSLFKAYALGDQYRQKAELEGLLRGAQIYHHNMSGDKAGAESDLLRHRLGQQKDPLGTLMLEQQVPTQNRALIERFIDSGSFGPSYDTPAVDGVGPVQKPPVDPKTMEMISRGVALYNKTVGVGGKMDDLAQADEINQRMRSRDAVLNDPAKALATSQAYFATSGHAPFDNVSNTGFSLDKTSGAQTQVNEVLANLFKSVENSKVAENDAQTAHHKAGAHANTASANLSNARLSRVNSGRDHLATMTDATGKPVLVAVPTQGEPVNLGLAGSKKTGADATNSKTVNAVIAAVEKDMPGATPDAIQKEIDKRLGRRGLDLQGNKKPTNGPDTPTIKPGSYQTAQEVKAAFSAGKLSRADATAILQNDFGMK